MGCTEQPAFACCLDMCQHVQQLRQHYLELWTLRLTTQGQAARITLWRDTCRAAREEEPRRARMRLFACNARGQWEPGCQPVPSRCCPVHQQPQCEQCWEARQGVAPCCAWAHVRQAVVMGDGLITGLAGMAMPPGPKSQAPAKQPCLWPTAVVLGRRPRPDNRSPSSPA